MRVENCYLLRFFASARGIIMAYTGELKEYTLVRQGLGAYVYKNKYFHYKGQWDEGKKHGKGVFTLGDGSSYEGDFRDGEITGIGLRRFTDGSTYSGGFKFGEMEGRGIYVSTTGEKYDGEMFANQRHGEGELTTATGEVYQGQFSRNKPHGEGTQYLVNGTVYQGKMCLGVRQGSGRLTYPGGQTYEGDWVNGGQHGEGAFCDPTCAFSFTGQWNNGSPIGVAKRFVLLDATLEKNEVTSKYVMNLAQGEGMPALRFLSTSSTLEEMNPTQEGEEGGEAGQHIPVPATYETGRILELRIFHIVQSEDGMITRVPACVLATASEMETLTTVDNVLNPTLLDGDSVKDSHLEDPCPTLIRLAAGADAVAVFEGFIVRPDVPEGTYEFVIADGTALEDTFAAPLIGLADSMIFEVTISAGSPKVLKKRK